MRAMVYGFQERVVIDTLFLFKATKENSSEIN